MSEVSDVDKTLSAAERVMAAAAELGRRGDREAATDELVRAAGSDRDVLVHARDVLVARLHADSSDYEATAALGVVNRAISRLGWVDPYCWKNRRKP